MRAALLATRALLAPGAHRFRRKLADPGAAQRRLLRDLAARLAATRYGRTLGVRSADDYLRRVPIVDFEALAPWLEGQRRDEGPVLARDRVIFYEKTSGSSGPAKYIPYTAALRASFSRMFALWAHDLLAHGPRFSTGRIYFSISPGFAREQPTARGVPVGLTDDAEYLEGWLRRLLEPFIVDTRPLAHLRDPEVFKLRLAETLLAAHDLEIISVWSPSFLKAVLDTLGAREDELAARLSPIRARALRRRDWGALWPALKLISCWASGTAAPQAAWLQRAFPGVLVQGKGLLATEAPVTFPLIEARGHVPLVDEVYLEFEDDAGQLRGLTDVAPGREYALIISQKAGLHRYRIGDRVRVTHLFARTPCLEFVARLGGVSDLVGEKLNETFVQGVLDGLGLGPAFLRILIPMPATRSVAGAGGPGGPGRAGDDRDRYVLLLDRCATSSVAIAGRLDAELMRAHHYRIARNLGQLAAPEVVVAPEAPTALTTYHLRRGMRWGDIKHPALLATLPDEELLAFLARAGGGEHRRRVVGRAH